MSQVTSFSNLATKMEPYNNGDPFNFNFNGQTLVAWNKTAEKTGEVVSVHIQDKAKFDRRDNSRIDLTKAKYGEGIDMDASKIKVIDPRTKKEVNPIGKEKVCSEILSYLINVFNEDVDRDDELSPIKEELPFSMASADEASADKALAILNCLPIELNITVAKELREFLKGLDTLRAASSNSSSSSLSSSSSSSLSSSNSSSSS